MKMMKRIMMFSLALMLAFACADKPKEDESKAENQEQIEKTGDVNVYYFHTSRRCATCNAVEDVARESVQELYGDMVDFAAYNIEDEDGGKIAEKVGVSGQALVVCCDGELIDLTGDAFMHARSNPDKLKVLIQETVDPFL
ncbi:MAG: nitrophenyl compound nitroreductase subunit ArsF family protein [Bacteroidales bacterium]|jgi:hypothetical protein|nr:nitrophenyl compound nitroreductase subunit ArsF family protein [Bacteroidales bacterium]